jgi:hypothetical protein
MSRKVLVCKADGKRPFGRPKCAWKDNIKRYQKSKATDCGFFLFNDDFAVTQTIYRRIKG